MLSAVGVCCCAAPGCSRQPARSGRSRRRPSTSSTRSARTRRHAAALRGSRHRSFPRTAAADAPASVTANDKGFPLRAFFGRRGTNAQTRAPRERCGSYVPAMRRSHYIPEGDTMTRAAAAFIARQLLLADAERDGRSPREAAGTAASAAGIAGRARCPGPRPDRAVRPDGRAGRCPRTWPLFLIDWRRQPTIFRGRVRRSSPGCPQPLVPITYISPAENALALFNPPKNLQPRPLRCGFGLRRGRRRPAMSATSGFRAPHVPGAGPRRVAGMPVTAAGNSR